MSNSPFGPQQPGQPPANPFADAPLNPNPYAPPHAYPPPQPIGDDPAMRWVLPVGTSVWAIVSGYCGLLSLAICFLGPIAVICGILAIREIRSNPRVGGLGRAIFGIVTGLLGSLGLALMIFALLSSGR